MSVFGPIADRLADVNDIVFVTGAGISQESGIPTFRGKDGLWRNHDAMRLATIYAFNEDPKLVWEWYDDRRRNVLGAEPNAGHLAIAELERYANVTVLTQNIDGLHQRAGSTRVVELHGNIIRTRCTVCDFMGEMLGKVTEFPPKCDCGNILRPDVVWFGEALNQEIWQNAMDIAGRCDLMVVAGTSMIVAPASTLPTYAKENDAVLVEVNLEDTDITSYVDLTVKGKSATVLPQWVSAVERSRESSSSSS